MATRIKFEHTLIHMGVETKVAKIYRVAPFGIPSGITADVFDAKGDIIVGTGDGTYDNLPKGADGYYLQSDSGQVTGLKWGPLAGSGNASLTNKAGLDRNAYDVVVQDPANDSAFKTTTTLGDKAVVGVLAEAILNNAVGLVAVAPQKITVNVQGNVTRGNFLWTSTTAARAADAGSLFLPGCFAIALTGYAGGAAGTVTALLLNLRAPKVVAAQMWLSGAGALKRTTDGFTDPVQEELATNKENFNDPIFPDGATKYGQWKVPMPSDYDGGTIVAKFYWRTTSASTNVVRWALRAVSWADSDALDAALGTAQAVDDANNAANDLNISALTAAITIAGGPLAGDLVLFEAYREGGHANDTLAADAKLIGIQLTYTRA